MPGGDGVHDELRPRYRVAAGEEAGHAGGQRLLVHDGEAAAYLLYLVVQTGDVGPLADGEDDHVGGEHVLRFGEHVEVGAAIHEAAEVHLQAAHTGHLAVLAGDLLERARGEELDPFLLGVQYLPLVGGHRLPGFQASHAHPGRAQPHGGGGGIYGHGAAAQYQYSVIGDQ